MRGFVMGNSIVDFIMDCVKQAVESTDSSVSCELTPDTVLFGKGGILDSAGLVSLIASIEDGLREKYGIYVSLADERAMSEGYSPYRTVGGLVHYTEESVIEEI